MLQTLIGIFKRKDKAQEAKEYLLTQGFNNKNVYIEKYPIAYIDNTTSENKRFKISNIFSKLVKLYDRAKPHNEAGSNSTMLIVHIINEQEIMEAVKVLNNYGALDIKEFSKEAETNLANNIKVTNEEIRVYKPDENINNIIKVSLPIGNMDMNVSWLKAM